MELRHYLAIIWRWSWFILLCTILGAIIAFGISLSTQPVYQASTTLLINPAPSTVGSPDYNSLLIGERLATTYAQTIRTRPILDQVITDLHLPIGEAALDNKLRITTIRDTELLVITVEDSNPTRAADIANEIVKVFVKQNQSQQSSRYAVSIQTLQAELQNIHNDMDRTQASIDALKDKTDAANVAERNRLDTLLSQSRSSYAILLKSLQDVQLAEAQTTNDIVVVEQAVPQSSPVRPRTLMNMLIGSVLGLMLGLAIVFLLDHLDVSVKSSEEVERLTGIPSLGTIGEIAGLQEQNSLVTVTNARSPAAEAYRVLQTNIGFAEIDSPIQTMLITSGGVGEGKSLTLANLAVIMARMGKRVIVVDTDLRKPALHNIFRLSNKFGVTTALMERESDVENYLVATGVENLRFLASGPLPPNPAELIGSQRMIDLVEKLKKIADLIVFDSPPSLAFADTSLLARMSDVTVLVVSEGQTQVDTLKKTRDQLVQSGTHLLGFVFNRATHPVNSYYYMRNQQKPRRFHFLRLPFISAKQNSQIPSSQVVIDKQTGEKTTSN